MIFGVSVTAFREHERGNFSWILECLAGPLTSPIVGDIVVYDDTASDDHFAALRSAIERVDPIRVRVVRGTENLGVMGAKMAAVAASRAEYLWLLDSDNTASREEVAVAANATLACDPNVLYCPSFGRPALDYRGMAGSYALTDIERFLAHPASGCAINTGNAVCHRDTFLAVMDRFRKPRWDLDLPDWLGVGDRSDLRWRVIYTSFDSGLINAAWWRAGGRIEIVPGLEYIHGSLTPEHQRAAPSSWERAPVEKDRIPGAVLADLRAEARAANGE